MTRTWHCHHAATGSSCVELGATAFKAREAAAMLLGASPQDIEVREVGKAEALEMIARASHRAGNGYAVMVTRRDGERATTWLNGRLLGDADELEDVRRGRGRSAR